MSNDTPAAGLIFSGQMFAFSLVTDGTASIACGQEHATMTAGSLLALSPSMQARLYDVSENFRMPCILLSPPFFDSLAVGQHVYNQLAGYRGRIPVTMVEGDTYACLHATIGLFGLRWSPDSMHSEGIARNMAALFLLQAAEVLHNAAHYTVPAISHAAELFRNFRRMLLSDYRTHHDIAYYAGRLCISPTYLSRIVKKTTGRTVRFHIDEQLSAEARRLLICTDMDIKEIASALCFSDQSAFGKFFRRTNGCAPTAFRRTNGRSA